DFREATTRADDASARAAPRRGLPALGEKLGDYVLESFLGKGGMGAVFVGRGAAGAVRAIKVPLFAGPGALEERARFEREVAILAKVPPHPNVVRIHAAGEDRGTAFAVLELVEGQGLDALLKRSEEHTSELQS